MKLLIILTALLMACNASAPGDAEDCELLLIDVDEENGQLRDQLYDLEMGVGEKVDLVADAPPPVDTDELSDTQRQISSLLAEIDRITAKHTGEIALKDAQYDGLLEEKYKDDDKCAAMASECMEFRGLVGSLPDCDLNSNGIWQSVGGAE